MIWAIVLLGTLLVATAVTAFVPPAKAAVGLRGMMDGAMTSHHGGTTGGGMMGAGSGSPGGMMDPGSGSMMGS